MRKSVKTYSALIMKICDNVRDGKKINKKKMERRNYIRHEGVTVRCRDDQELNSKENEDKDFQPTSTIGIGSDAEEEELSMCI